MPTTDAQRTYYREWQRRRRLNPDAKKRDSSSTRRWQKANPITHGWYNDQRSAAKRGHEWTLSKETYEKLRLLNCTYCGIEPAPAHGIDRLDNAKGYTEGNSVTACADCNYAKRKMSVSEFLTWAQRLVRFNSGE
jgi:hypothetical protein